MLCDAGRSAIYICEYANTVSRGVECSNKKYLGTLDNFSLLEEPVLCTNNTCPCIADAKAAKYCKQYSSLL